MAGMLEQILRNVGELGLLKQPVRGQGITAAPDVSGGGSTDTLVGSDTGPKSQAVIDAEEGDKKIDEEVQRFKDTWLAKLPKDKATSYGDMIDQARAGIDDNGPQPLINLQGDIIKEVTKAGEKTPEYDPSNPNLPEEAKAAIAAGATRNVVDQIIAGKFKAGDGGSSAYRIPREGLPPWAKYMTDSDISDLMKKQQEAGSQGSSGDVYPRLKGTSLKIMNDDTFKRSGLKTGDTVCIRIP